MFFKCYRFKLYCKRVMVQTTEECRQYNRWPPPSEAPAAPTFLFAICRIFKFVSRKICVVTVTKFAKLNLKFDLSLIINTASLSTCAFTQVSSFQDDTPISRYLKYFGLFYRNTSLSYPLS